MRRPTYFDIPASDAARAISFYSKLFGWRFVRREEGRDYWTIIEASPSGAEFIGGLAPLGFYPGKPELNGFINAYVCYFPVTDIDGTLRTMGELGGMTFSGKQHIPGFGWRALAKDSEGNVLGLIQHEPKH